MLFWMLFRLKAFHWPYYLLGLFFFIGCGGSSEQSSRVAEGQFPDTFDAERAELLSPQTCAECHKESTDHWLASHHAKANRLIGAHDVDQQAFRTKEVISGKAKFELKPNLTMIENREDGSVHQHKPVGVIGYTPLIQYLLPFDRGRFQCLSSAYDPGKDEWFYVFGEGEDRRLPGEWGHWTGQGNNWNANCAACHMTDYQKNYDLETESYDSQWLHQSITCIECHQGMDEHVKLAREGKDHEVAYNEPTLAMENCASCHSRRQELTKDRFKPGERYHDHYRLSLPDAPGVYHGDGQVANEDFVYGSLMMSKMGHKGVNCFDCHNPHTNQLLLPVENNQLCLHCHSTGNKGATKIDPSEHTFHKEGSAGNQCVECHMPSTPFMQRDPRRDHGFTSPDPVLTKEFGIPNSCNRCHQDQDVDWAINWTERWYGDKMENRVRRRARAVERFHRGENTREVMEELLALAKDEEIDAWRAALVGMLRVWVSEFKVRQFLREKLEDKSYLVRSAAARGLESVDVAVPWLEPLLEDEARLVRIDAAQALMRYGKLTDEARAELQEYLEMSADQPISSLRLAEWAMYEAKNEEALEHVRRAIRLDAAGVDVYLDAAVLSSRMNMQDEALGFVRKAVEVRPDSARAHFWYGLLLAEKKDMPGAVFAFQETVKHNPEYARAWYNLALGLNQLQRRKEAVEAIQKAIELEPYNPEFMRAAESLGLQVR